MATAVNSVSNYSGKPAGEIMVRAFKETSTLASDFITINENVNHKLNLRRLELTGGRRNYSCGFVAGGGVDMDEKVLEPKKLRDDIELCKEDFRNQWDDGNLGASAMNNEGDMKEIMDAVVAAKLAEEADEIDDMIWTGDNNADGEFGGFIPQFIADNEINKVAGTTITKDNVEAELMKALNAVPTKMLKKAIKVGVASNIMTAYSHLLISRGIHNGLGGDANTELKFGKFMLVEITGLPDNNMVIAEKKNLVFGTGKQADFNNIRVIDTSETTGDDTFRLTMVYNGGVGYFYGDEITWYRPASVPSV
jgi:hypothetical protein